MTSRPILIVAVVILTVIIAALAIWTLGPNPQPTIPTTPSPTPAKNGTATLGELVLCKDFQEVEGEIACEDALGIAKKKYAGTVQNISSGTFRRTEDEQSAGIGIWRVEIKLDKPVIRNNNSFDEIRLFLNRETGEEFRITR